MEITGIARCNVKTMWMKGESFGLFEAVVELFGDDEDHRKEKEELQVTRSIRSSATAKGNGGTAAVVAEAEAEKAASDLGVCTRNG